MKTVWPDYFEKFQCIADRCRHSCCEGWEIDIDDDTAELYSAWEGSFGDELRASMEADEDGVCHFILTKQEKCPFLQANGLCRMILSIGEENLCDICREHPRFYNYYGDVEESGVGMCCEEAVRLLLRSDFPTRYIACDDGEDSEENADIPEIISQKKQILFILHSSGLSFTDKLTACAKVCYCKSPVHNVNILLPLFMRMDIMNPAWKKYLTRMQEQNISFGTDDIPNDMVSEKLLEYFVYRHFKPGQYSAEQILGFCLAGVLLVRAMDLLDDELEEHIRLYSSEIEYCEDNIDLLMNLSTAVK